MLPRPAQVVALISTDGVFVAPRSKRDEADAARLKLAARWAEGQAEEAGRRLGRPGRLGEAQGQFSESHVA